MQVIFISSQIWMNVFPILVKMVGFVLMESIPIIAPALVVGKEIIAKRVDTFVFLYFKLENCHVYKKHAYMTT